MAVTPVNLQDIQQGRAIVDDAGRPTHELLGIVNGNTRNMRQVLNDQGSMIADLAAQLLLIQQAQAAADAAQTDATAAAREAARINSYTAPTNVLSAEDAGTTATINVAAHTRIYPVQGSIDVPDVVITAGAITGLAYSTVYYVFYDDTTLVAVAPTFQATTNIAAAQVGYAAGRHFVGKVTTPAAGGATTSGTGGSTPPGGGGGEILP